MRSFFVGLHRLESGILLFWIRLALAFYKVKAQGTPAVALAAAVGIFILKMPWGACPAMCGAGRSSCVRVSEEGCSQYDVLMMSCFYCRKSRKIAEQKTWFFAQLTPLLAVRTPFGIATIVALRGTSVAGLAVHRAVFPPRPAGRGRARPFPGRSGVRRRPGAVSSRGYFPTHVAFWPFPPGRTYPFW